MRHAHDGNLIVVARTAIEIRKRVKVYERERLRADAILRNHATRERHSGHRIDWGAATRREISRALRSGRHSRSLHAGVSILRAIVGRGEGTHSEDTGNNERAVYADRGSEAAVIRPRR